jgi:hypothetical protein
MCCLISCCTATAQNRSKADVSGNNNSTNTTNADADIDDNSVATDRSKNDDNTAAGTTNATAVNAETSAGESYNAVIALLASSVLNIMGLKLMLHLQWKATHYAADITHCLCSITDESNRNNANNSSSKRSRHRKEPSIICTPAQASAKRIAAERCGKTWSFVCPCGQKSNSFSHQEALQQHSNSSNSNSGCRTPTRATSASHDTTDDDTGNTTAHVQEDAVEVVDDDTDGGAQFECSTCGVSSSCWILKKLATVSQSYILMQLTLGLLLVYVMYAQVWNHVSCVYESTVRRELPDDMMCAQCTLTMYAKHESAAAYTQQSNTRHTRRNAVSSSSDSDDSTDSSSNDDKDSNNDSGDDSSNDDDSNSNAGDNSQV